MVDHSHFSAAERPFLPSTGFVRLPVVLQHIPVSRSTWWEGVRTGRFPQPVKIGGVTAWRVERIRQLIEDLGAAGATQIPTDGEGR